MVNILQRIWGAVSRSGTEEATRSWEAAKTTRLNSDQFGRDHGEPLNQKLSLDLETLRNRCLAEAERNGWIEGMICSHVNSVVGVDGPALQIHSDSEDFNTAAEKVWSDWWEKPDYNEQLSGADLLRQAVRSLWTCGEFVWHLTSAAETPEADIRLRLQDIHPKRLRSPLLGSYDTTAVGLGVKRDDQGKPLAYYVDDFLVSEQLGATASSREIAAEFIIHGFKQREPGQIRGVPWLAPGLQVAADLRCYNDQVMDAARAAADMSIVLYTDHPDAPYVAVNETVAIQRRTMRTLPPGWKPTQVTAQQPGSTYKEYVRERLRELGRPVNMPLMMVLLDSAEHSYSSARFDGQLFNRGVAADQRWICRVALNRLVRMVLREAQLAGKVPAAPQSYDTVWTWEAAPHVDPTKESQADQTNLELGVTTLAEVCAARGKDWEQVIDQRVREKAALETAGLPLGPYADKPAPMQQQSGQQPTPSKATPVSDSPRAVAGKAAV